MKTERLLQYLDDYLGVPEFPDYRTALNGLQVEAPERVERLAAAVDASEETIRGAVDAGADLLLVHHGLFWGGLQPATGRRFRKLAALIRHETGLYSAHLPLDAHPEVGNCAVLARALGFEPKDRFGRYEETRIGWSVDVDLERDALRDRLAATLDADVRLVAGGADRIRRAGIVTGSGGSFIEEAARSGLDALVTGEGSHHDYVDATELGLNVYYGGHYATETWGVEALAEHLCERFDVSWTFIDAPSGL